MHFKKPFWSGLVSLILAVGLVGLAWRQEQQAAVASRDMPASNWLCDSGSRALILHWNGADWSVVPSPGIGTLRGVAAVAATDVWAVGDYQVIDNHVERSQALILHWDGKRWNNLASPDPGTGNFLQGVAAFS